MGAAHSGRLRGGRPSADPGFQGVSHLRPAARPAPALVGHFVNTRQRQAGQMSVQVFHAYGCPCQPGSHFRALAGRVTYGIGHQVANGPVVMGPVVMGPVVMGPVVMGPVVLGPVVMGAVNRRS
jgi:hypothetical protein